MDLATIIERMAVLGLTRDEAELYVRLTLQGPSKASDLTGALRVGRSEVYRLLQNLVQRGYVTATLTRPTRFEAAPPERLFEQVFAQHEQAWEDVARAQADIVGALAAARERPGPASPEPTFRILAGRGEAGRAVGQALHRAQRSVRLLATGPPGAGRLGDGEDLWDLLLRRAHEGLAVEAAVRAVPAALARARDLPSSLSVRESALRRAVQFLIIDDAEVLAWAVAEALPRRPLPDRARSADGEAGGTGGPATGGARSGGVVLASDAPGLVASFLALFELAWAGAREVSRTAAPPREA